MKALTIWQPWASLLACGAKQYETIVSAFNRRRLSHRKKEELQ